MRPGMMLVMACLFSGSLEAAQFVVSGDYRIHYTAFPSLLLPPEVAAAHGMTRAENLIVLNVSLEKSGQHEEGDLSGFVTNLLDQRSRLEFDEIREADAIYYLASHTATEQDILRFDITIVPPGHEPVNIRFVRRYD